MTTMFVFPLADMLAPRVRAAMPQARLDELLSVRRDLARRRERRMGRRAARVQPPPDGAAKSSAREPPLPARGGRTTRRARTLRRPRAPRGRHRALDPAR